MKSRSKSISVFLTLLLACSTVAMSSVQSGNTNGRATGAVPGFTGLIAIMSISCALVFIALRREDE